MFIRVDKWLAVRPGATEGLDEVLDRDYAYHCYLARRPEPLPLLRYDNAHGHGGMHRHVFHLSTGDELQVDVLDQATELPTLDQVIREATRLGELATQQLR